MKVVLAKGRSQYGSLRLHIDQLASALRDLGHEAQVVDMIGEGGLGPLVDALGTRPDCFFTFNSMALGGPVQGQILGATTFTNTGTIDLQANPVPGDVLLISGSHTPSTTGGGSHLGNTAQAKPYDTCMQSENAARKSAAELWSKVKAAGKQFALIRVSDGTGHLDPDFTSNWKNAKAAGLVVGAYQFFRPTENPTSQADLLLSHPGSVGSGPGHLPPVSAVGVRDAASLAGFTELTRLA